MRFLFLFFILFSTYFTSYSQELTQAELEQKLNKDWCVCMGGESTGKTAEQVISEASTSCIQNVMTKYTQDEKLYDNIRKLIAQKGYDSSLSDYQKERLFGRELGKNLIKNAVDNCPTFRQSLIQFKTYYIELAKKEMNANDKKEVDELIINISKQLDGINTTQIDNSQTKKQISELLCFVGIAIRKYRQRNSCYRTIQQGNSIRFRKHKCSRFQKNTYTIQESITSSFKTPLELFLFPRRKTSF